MTSIPSSTPLPIETSSRLPGRQAGANGDGSGFAACLAAIGEGSPADVEAATSRLSAAVAHVFNQFGFFPDGASGQAAAPPSAWVGAAAPVPGREGTGKGAGEGPDGSAPQPRPDRLAGAAEPWPNQQGRPEARSSLDLAQSRRSYFRGMSNSEGAAELAEGIQRRGTAERQAPTPHIPVGRLQEKSSDAEKVRDDRPSRGAASQARDSRSPERLVFRIAGHGVELSGRLPGLGDEERERLLEALSEILSGHGLSLASATLNGRPVPAALLRRSM